MPNKPVRNRAVPVYNAVHLITPNEHFVAMCLPQSDLNGQGGWPHCSGGLRPPTTALFGGLFNQVPINATPTKPIAELLRLQAPPLPPSAFCSQSLWTPHHTQKILHRVFSPSSKPMTKRFPGRSNLQGTRKPNQRKLAYWRHAFLVAPDDSRIGKRRVGPAIRWSA